jgi:hypothetical protein
MTDRSALPFASPQACHVARRFSRGGMSHFTVSTIATFAAVTAAIVMLSAMVSNLTDKGLLFHA